MSRDDKSWLDWAVSRWRRSVEARPLHNIYRRTLDSCWRQVIRRAGGDDVTICGPRHDDLVAAGNAVGMHPPHDPADHPDDFVSAEIDLSPRILIDGVDMTAQIRAAAAPSSVEQGGTDVTDALYDSAYIAGLHEGWNRCAEGDQAGYTAIIEARAGYLKPIREAHAAKVASPSAPAADEPSPLAFQLYAALVDVVAAIKLAGVLQHRDYDSLGIRANTAIAAYQHARDVTTNTFPARAQAGTNTIAEAAAIVREILGPGGGMRCDSNLVDMLRTLQCVVGNWVSEPHEQVGAVTEPGVVDIHECAHKLPVGSRLYNHPPRGQAGEAVAPVAFVPVHPVTGPLWADAYSAEAGHESRVLSYPRMALYAAPATDARKECGCQNVTARECIGGTPDEACDCDCHTFVPPADARDGDVYSIPNEQLDAVLARAVCGGESVKFYLANSCAVPVYPDCTRTMMHEVVRTILAPADRAMEGT